MRKELSVERTPRTVIEGKLLAALDDQGKVAIVASENDISMLIAGLKNLPSECTLAAEFAHDLTVLKEEAFGT